MNNWFKRLRHMQARLFAALVTLTPLLAEAAWDTSANTELRNFRIALYGLTGTAAVATLIWKGAQWMIARSQGDHSVTAMDYVQQVVLIVLVGGSAALAIYAWGMYGTGVTA